MTEPPTVPAPEGWFPEYVLDDNGAKIKIGERRCKRPAIEGGRVCMHHGGGLPSTKQKAAERKGYAEAKKAVAIKLGMVVADRDPRQVLLEQVYAAYGMVIASRSLLDEVDPEDLFAGASDSGDSWAARGKMTLYAEWVDRAARISKMALDAGIDERMVKLAEQQSNIVINVLNVVITNEELGLEPAIQAQIRRLIAQEFRNLASGNPGEPLFDMVPTQPMQASARPVLPQIASATQHEIGGKP